MILSKPLQDLLNFFSVIDYILSLLIFVIQQTRFIAIEKEAELGPLRSVNLPQYLTLSFYR